MVFFRSLSVHVPDSRLYCDVMDAFDLNPWLLGSCLSAAYHVLSPKACNIVCPYWNLTNDQGPTVILANCKHIRNTLAIRAASTASKRYPCTLIATFCNKTFAHNSTKMHTCRSFASLRKSTLTSAHQKRVLPDTLQLITFCLISNHGKWQFAQQRKAGVKTVL